MPLLYVESGPGPHAPAVGRATVAQHVKSDPREQPKSQQTLERVTVRFLPPPGGIILFSGGQLRETVPNMTSVARYIPTRPPPRAGADLPRRDDSKGLRAAKTSGNAHTDGSQPVHEGRNEGSHRNFPLAHFAEPSGLDLRLGPVSGPLQTVHVDSDRHDQASAGPHSSLKACSHRMRRDSRRRRFG